MEYIFKPRDYDEWVDIRVKSKELGHDVINDGRVNIKSYISFPYLVIEVRENRPINLQGCGRSYKPFSAHRISVREGLSILGMPLMRGNRHINTHKFI